MAYIAAESFFSVKVPQLFFFLMGLGGSGEARFDQDL